MGQRKVYLTSAIGIALAVALALVIADATQPESVMAAPSGYETSGITAASAGLKPPLPPELADGAGIIKSKKWALVLGKAFFWDQQAGSDGNACASCHFHAGADTRLTNQLTPGFKDISKGLNGDRCPRALLPVPTTRCSRKICRCTAWSMKPTGIRPFAPPPTTVSPPKDLSTWPLGW